VRLSKYLADAGIASRRKSEKLISDGRVKVNGEIVREQGRLINPDLDMVEIDGTKVQAQDKIYLMLNKPAGYLSSTFDPQGRPTVMELLKGIKGRLYPVGRLDLDTRGLLLLSNDGDFTNLIIHPRYHIEKKYQAQVEGLITPEAVETLTRGVHLEDGPTAPARVKVLKCERGSTLIEIVIHEGRKRQVKRMLAAVGFPVISLSRIALAFLTLEDLPEGQYRPLQPDEVDGLRELAQFSSKKK
jgi:23S rRNA pseudouridine2605 synthase